MPSSSQVAEIKQPKELNVDLDALKAIEMEDAANYENEKKKRRRIQEEARQEAEKQQEQKEGLSRLFFASAFSIIVVLAAITYYFSATKVEIKESYPLFIETVPFDAKIEILNIEPKYKLGILLKPGEYSIKISKKGYVTQRFLINMEHENKIIKRELLRPKKRKTY
jgi:hypothetical protein